MTGPQVRKLDWGEVPPNQTPPEVRALQNLNQLIKDVTTQKANEAAGLRTLLNSGLVDTLMKLVGPHNITAPDKKPDPWYGLSPWGNTLGLNVGQDATGTGNIRLDPAILRDIGRPLPTDRVTAPFDITSHNNRSVAEVIAHEFGHSVEEKAPLFPEDTPRGYFKANLGSQWEAIVQKRASTNKTVVDNLDHDGWWKDDKGNLRPGRGEMFAESFSHAVNLLRLTQKGAGAGADFAGVLRNEEKSHPGITYLTRWLTSQPEYRTHPAAALFHPPIPPPPPIDQDMAARTAATSSAFLQAGKDFARPQP